MGITFQYKNISLTQFLELLDREKFTWIIKRLSGNDTGITGGHQAGIYVPRNFMESIVPSIVTTKILNPTKEIDCYISSHDCLKAGIQAKYYNNKFFPELGMKKGYNEFRMTRWSQTPLQEEENTGGICILAGLYRNAETTFLCWVTRSEKEEDLVESWLGKEVEPGIIYSSSLTDEIKTNPIFKELPSEWFNQFPTGKDIFRFVEKKIPQALWTKSIDDLLMWRRRIEFDVFTEVERRDVMPNIKNGFKSVNEFIRYSNSVANRRKSRAGTSLELHLESIFRYAHLQFETQVVTEQKKKPDFIFPSARAYHNLHFPSSKLHMLASKTCCKDRWRQIITEADRIKQKHLFTLQEGISSNQLEEMYQHDIILVVPQPAMKSFPEEFRPRIINLTNFVAFIQESQSTR